MEENKIFKDNPVLKGSGTTQPRKVEDSSSFKKGRECKVNFTLNGALIRGKVVPGGTGGEDVEAAINAEY